MASSVELLAVSKSFDTTLAVDCVSLHIRQGEFFSLLGSSGCGKSTVLRLIAGFENPDAGEIRVAGGAANAREPAYARKVNMVFQNYALFPHMSVAENVSFGLRMAGMPRADREKKTREMLGVVQLEGLEARMPSQLSGGQQQRVALARAMATEPQVVLLDEPLGALDLKLRRGMQQELKRIQQSRGLTFVYVTHDQEEALSMSDRLCVMHGGRAMQTGTPRDIYAQPVSRFIAEFIGENNILLQPDGSLLAVRPEEIRCTAPEHRGPLTGIVTELIYQGADALLLVRLPDNTIVKVRRPGREGTLPPGTEVTLAWPEEAARLLPHHGS